MKQSTFKNFIAAVKESKSNDPVWYAGYLWLNLTERQVKKTIDALIIRGDCPVEKRNGKYCIVIPSGIALEINSNEVRYDG